MDANTSQRLLGDQLCQEFMRPVLQCIRRALPPLAGTR